MQQIENGETIEWGDYLKATSRWQKKIKQSKNFVEYLKKEKVKKDDELTEEQELQFEEAIRQADAGETMSLDEFKKKMSTWHTK